jgi:ABC-type molybdate transport system substrate-binding protein
MSFIVKFIIGFSVLSSANLVAVAEQTQASATSLQLIIAASPELTPVITRLARAFEQRNDNLVRVMIEPRANFDWPLRTRSTFDAVFTSDGRDLRRRVTSGTIASSSVTEVARDQLVICISPLVRCRISAAQSAVRA